MESTYQHKERFAMMSQWASKGAGYERALLPIELSFQERISTIDKPPFIPVDLRDNGAEPFNRQVSYLIDAFDAFPRRVDQSFDSTWKAFESTLDEVDNSTWHINPRIKKVVDRKCVPKETVDSLCANVPVQTCEYLFKRLVFDQKVRDRVFKREDLLKLLGYIENKYDPTNEDDRRKGAILLRRVLRREENLTVASDTNFELEERSLSLLLISGILYTTRNDRIHGNSFSPFVSSVASLKTYTHPYFAFISTYYVLLSMWLHQNPNVINGDKETVKTSMHRNITVAKSMFRRHWSS